jgi:hypothetical protein
VRECTPGNTACLNDLELGAPCHVVAGLLHVIIRFMAKKPLADNLRSDPIGWSDGVSPFKVRE